eukprot:TRINITY_DN10312_c0_g1_i1.p1 TRINITY_DN10312_c0_g1~~TRINITY_DN10312_c0_g1_i1.p1  ORF type:complete len:304 (-),score=17.09 TRINITY_DN10312_c0_g1_i1:138-1004(-)
MCIRDRNMALTASNGHLLVCGMCFPIVIALKDEVVVHDLAKPSYPILCGYKMEEEIKSVGCISERDIIVTSASAISYFQASSADLRLVLTSKITKEEYKTTNETCISGYTDGKQINAFLYQPEATHIAFLIIRPPIIKEAYIHKLHYLMLNKFLPLYNYTKAIMIKQVSPRNVLFWGRDEGVDKIFLGLFDVYEEPPSISSYKYMIINVPREVKKVLYANEKEATIIMCQNRIIMKSSDKNNELALEEPIYDFIQLKPMTFAGLGINRIDIISSKDDKLVVMKVILLL